MRRAPQTCLERSLILQRWHFAHGWHRDIIIGVTAPREGFTAHAWLDGAPEDVSDFSELLRLPAR